MKKIHLQNGFSLIELILVLGFLSFIAIENPLSFYRSYSLKNESSKIKDLIKELQISSIIGGESLKLEIARASYIWKNDNKIIGRYRFPKNISATFNSNQIQKLTFSPSGTASPATIKLRSKEQRCSIIVSLRGRARIECEL